MEGTRGRQVHALISFRGWVVLLSFSNGKQARLKRGAGGGFSPPNNLLKLADFVSEKS